MRVITDDCARLLFPFPKTREEEEEEEQARHPQLARKSILDMRMGTFHQSLVVCLV